MSPPLNRINSDERLPAQADVVVIGGGVIGVSAAYHLAKKGLSVALVEKGHVGGEQSSRNWGWCRQQGRAREEIPLAREALRLWEDMQNDAGVDAGFRRTGVLFLTKSKDELAGWERWAAIAREQQVHSTVLTPAEVAERMPGNADKWVGGLHTPSDGRAEPSMAVPALATAARKHGVTIHQGCAARGLETTGGRVSAVVTEKGTIRAQSVLLSGGAWSSLFCRRHGIELPIGLVNATACRTTPGPEITSGALGTDFYCIRRRLDGGFTLALRNRGTVELSPDLFRYARTFWPTYLHRRNGLKMSFGKSVLRPAHARHQLEPRQAVAVRDRTGARSRARHVAGQCGAISADQVQPRIEGHQDRGSLGRHDRLHARYDPGDLAGRCAAGLLPRHRLLRPRLRHRPCGRQARRRHRDRLDAAGRS
ncbi:glycine/D-amino acid oxidase-like deaminating enzyme [Bradyrhizobium diazoefficiens]